MVLFFFHAPQSFAQIFQSEWPQMEESAWHHMAAGDKQNGDCTKYLLHSTPSGQTIYEVHQQINQLK